MIQIVHNSTQAILQLVCSVSDSGIPTATLLLANSVREHGFTSAVPEMRSFLSGFFEEANYEGFSLRTFSATLLVREHGFRHEAQHF